MQWHQPRRGSQALDMRQLLRGGLAGFLATLPMTLTMGMLHRVLPWYERYPLPPREITARLTSRARYASRSDAPQHQALDWAAHFAFGTAAGMVYAPLAQQLPLPPITRGAVYGLGVWAGNYLGLLPALGLLRPATQHPLRRTALMIAAHVLWGAALDWTMAGIQRRAA